MVIYLAKQKRFITKNTFIYLHSETKLVKLVSKDDNFWNNDILYKLRWDVLANLDSWTVNLNVHIISKFEIAK